jgi:hypothetical protein
MDGMERKGQELSTHVFDRVRLVMQGNCVRCASGGKRAHLCTDITRCLICEIYQSNIVTLLWSESEPR